MTILKQLLITDPKIAELIEKEAEKLLKTIDLEMVCEEVYSDLDFLDVEDLWDRSGPSRDGYMSPEEMAFEMVENELEPYKNQVMKYFDLGMTKEAKKYCMGVLKGIYRWEKESKSEFKDWAADVAGECFDFLLEEWQKKTTDENNIVEMDKFLKKECSQWV